jgi:hypothetical protein
MGTKTDTIKTDSMGTKTDTKTSGREDQDRNPHSYA